MTGGEQPLCLPPNRSLSSAFLPQDLASISDGDCGIACEGESVVFMNYKTIPALQVKLGECVWGEGDVGRDRHRCWVGSAKIQLRLDNSKTLAYLSCRYRPPASQEEVTPFTGTQSSRGSGVQKAPSVLGA